MNTDNRPYTWPAQPVPLPASAAATAGPTALTEADIEAEFPRWHVWRTADAGTWWATQRGRAWSEPRTLAADDADGLRAVLSQAHNRIGH